MGSSVWLCRPEYDSRKLSPGAVASVRHVKATNGLREQHQERAATLKRRLSEVGLPVMISESHIVPVMISDPVLCKQITDDLLYEHGIYVQPINYPTVPKGTERLRLTPSPVHTDDMMTDLIRALEAVWLKFGLEKAA